MMTNLLLGLGLVSLVVSPPDLSKMELMGSQAGMCPDGSVVQIDFYDPDPTIEEVVMVYKREGDPVGIFDQRNLTVYVFADHTSYTLEEVSKKWPTPCDLPYKGKNL